MSAVAYLVLANPSAKHNLGTLIRCAAAFAVEEVVVVGVSKWSTHGAHGSNKHVRYRCFDDWETAASFLRIEMGCDLCGIIAQSQIRNPGREAPVGCTPPSTPTPGSVVPGKNAESTAAAAAIAHADEKGGPGTDDGASANNAIGNMPAVVGRGTGAAAAGGSEDRSLSASSSSSEEDARESTALGVGGEKKRYATAASTAVRRRPFRRSTAFLVGHRNRLEHEALQVCDFFVHVEQANESPMDLGAPVTTSIALHHFTAWAHYEERRFTGEKFNVDPGVARCRPPAQKEKNRLADERLRSREELRAADPLAAPPPGGEGADVGWGLGWLAGLGDDDIGQGDY